MGLIPSLSPFYRYTNEAVKRGLVSSTLGDGIPCGPVLLRQAEADVVIGTLTSVILGSILSRWTLFPFSGGAGGTVTGE